MPQGMRAHLLLIGDLLFLLHHFERFFIPPPRGRPVNRHESTGFLSRVSDMIAKGCVELSMDRYDTVLAALTLAHSQDGRFDIKM